MIREALTDMIDTIDREVQHNRQHRITALRVTSPTTGSLAGSPTPARRNENGIDGVNGRREPLFVQRRPYLRTFIRNLLVLDYFFMLLLFPFSLYNILRFGFSSVTLSQNDFILEIVLYCQTATDFSPLSDGYRLKEASMDLLGKFHNIVVYYSWPPFKRALLRYTEQSWFQQVLLQTYQFLVKTTAISIYLAYGIGGTVYLAIAGFFFSICIVVTVVRRYKNVQRIVAASLESSVALPGIF